MGFKETYQKVKADASAGEKNFNVVVESQPDGSFLASMGQDFKFNFDAPPGLVSRPRATSGTSHWGSPSISL